MKKPAATAATASGAGDVLFTRLITDHPAAIGCRLDELEGLRQSGAVVLAIRRNDQILAQPDPSDSLQSGDGLWLAGTEAQLTAAEKACRGVLPSSNA